MSNEWWKSCRVGGKRTGENHAWYIDLLGIVWKFRGMGSPFRGAKSCSQHQIDHRDIRHSPSRRWGKCVIFPLNHILTSPIQIRPWHNGSMIGSYWVYDGLWFWLILGDPKCHKKGISVLFQGSICGNHLRSQRFSGTGLLHRQWWNYTTDTLQETFTLRKVFTCVFLTKSWGFLIRISEYPINAVLGLVIHTVSIRSIQWAHTINRSGTKEFEYLKAGILYFSEFPQDPQDTPKEYAASALFGGSIF